MTFNPRDTQFRQALWFAYTECPEKTFNPCFSCNAQMSVFNFEAMPVVKGFGYQKIEDYRPTCSKCVAECGNQSLFVWMSRRSRCLFSDCVEDANCGWYCESHQGENRKQGNACTIANLEQRKALRAMKDGMYEKMMQKLKKPEPSFGSSPTGSAFVFNPSPASYFPPDRSRFNVGVPMKSLNSV